ncbi:MAG TPA: lytic polysaccharide monooxygenase [Stackebrandtia sp.]|jgi:chitin-binding protein|uniref:lytic polysaccharide monooxygenase auxiliary activity family 9 protein n=1 Tax=Stackebrandtia sp. TaxID=2023065 RepID=UPI002D3F3C6E|nr:lytic polysaccharide monooxygenase [Stackebrandtia sp.]HZE40066.1 lytic polysaccharide monooxygenase [Stackebrandtia sp.]
MSTLRPVRAMLALTAGLLAAVVAGVLGATPAFAHGYTTTPTSRALFCQQGAIADCGDIQWEPQSVEGPKGFPDAGPADGQICAGGNSRFSQLDQVRAWPSNHVSAGSYTFSWHFTARHSTTDFRYYITKDGWDSGSPLTRADLDLNPFLVVPFQGQPPADLSHTGNIPARSGHHIILAVWTIADTGNAFYQCSDVDF